MTYRRDETTDAGRQPSRFITELAEDAETVLAAQRLRYRVFHAANAPGDAAEPQARDEVGKIDHDAFDRHCEHLIVRDARSAAVVGTYRILTAERARDAGGFYSETEFDCSRLRRLDARLVEVGRACVDPAYRGGSVITLLLAGLTRWVVANRYAYVMGCASIDLTAGLAPAATLCRALVAEHLAPEAWRVAPHIPFRPGDLPACHADLPPLIKAYLRFGASVCGEPAWDAEFQTADLLMLLPMAAMAPRFRARLLRGDPPPPKPRSSRWAA
jgi:putative hemolysin